MALKDPTDKDKAKFFTNITEDKADHGKHPNSLKNLQKWEKGQTGNSIGRPLKYQLLKEKLNELGEQITEDFRGKKLGTRKEQLLKTIWKKAIDGDIQYTKILLYIGVFDNEEER